MESNLDLSTTRFASLIQEKLRLVVEIKKLVDKQKRLIDSEKTEDLMSLLAVKQQVVRGLTQNDQELEPFRSQQPEHRVWTSGEARQQCQQCADLCESIFKEVLELEAYCEKAMSDFSQTTQRQLSGTVSAQQATNAYRSFTPPAASQLDLTSDS